MLFNRSEEDIKKLEAQLAEAPKPEDLARYYPYIFFQGKMSSQ